MAGGFFHSIIPSVSSFSFGMRIFSKKSAEKISLKFVEAGLQPDSASAYLSGSLLLSFAFALAALAASSFLLHTNATDSLAASLLSFSFALGFFILLPSALAWRARQQSESELPFLLREFAIYLDIGMPFEKCIAKISTRGYSLSPEFLRAWKEMKSGATCQAALSSISLRTGSMQIKRCMLLLSSIYESGTGAEPLKRTAEELSHAQLSSSRSQSSRLSVLAIAFIAASALAPSFFSVYAAVSPVISDSQLPEWQMWLAFLLLFPLLNFFVLAAMSFLFPASPLASSGGAGLLEEFLKKQGFHFGQKAFIILLAAISVILAIVFLLFSQPLAALLSMCIAPALYSFASYAAGREISEAESRLPDALYSAASVHRLLSPEKMLLLLSKGGFGRLSDSFSLALRRQNAGEGFASSLQAAAEYCPSPLVERAFSLLVVAYETGANMYFALREAAEDVVSFFSLVRERSALLSLQRYTILASSAFLVPVILGTVLSIVPSLSSAASSISASSGLGLLSSLALACQIYLVINAALSSFMLALSETNAKKAVLYFSFIAPVSQILFSLAVAGTLPSG